MSTKSTASWRVASTRGIAAFMAIAVVFTLRPAHGSPGDIFTIPAPMLGADPPKTADLKVGDASVSTQTGALQYSFALQTPPGRNGMAPSLGLSYSSQASIFGGIAAGWSLPVAMISEDHSHGRLETRSPEVEFDQFFQGLDLKADDRFVSSLAGGRPLVAVTEPVALASGVYKAYRAANDSSWTRYERMAAGQSFRWRARATDGTVMTFGESTRTPGCLISDQHAPLTGSIDEFGNEIAYEYVMSEGECMLSRITYGQNGSLPAFAEIVFDFHPTLCNGIPIGSRSDYRTGVKLVTGANAIYGITAYARDPATSVVVHTRKYTLAYDPATEACNATLTHAPIRQLKSIQESAWGVDAMPRVDLPAVTFDYNAAETTLAAPTGSQGTPWGSLSALQNLGWGYRRQDDRWPTVESMLQDIDGDGLQDLVTNTSSATNPESCTAAWRRNQGPNGANGHPVFSTIPREIALPRLKWGGTTNPPGGATAAVSAYPQFEGCALNGQVTVFENSDKLFGQCHDEARTPCASSANPNNNLKLYCYLPAAPGGTECPPGAGGLDPGNTGAYRTYLAYRWLDVDSDGLVDLVAAPHGDIDHYDIELGSRFQNLPGEPPISGIPGFGTWPACPSTDRCKVLDDCLERNARPCMGGNCAVDWAAVNACTANTPSAGCATVMAKLGEPPEGAPPPALGLKRAPYTRCDGLYPWLIYKNLGDGVFATTATVKYQPVPLESDNGDSNFSGPSVVAQSHAIMDFDGDGRLDAVVRDGTAGGTGSIAWQVWLGDGTGGFGPRLYTFPTRPINCGPPCAFNPGDNALSGTGSIWDLNGYIASNRGLTDFNGDGLPDHWKSLPAGNVDVALHIGTELQLSPPMTDPVGAVATPATPIPLKLGNDGFITATDSTGAVINPYGQQILWGHTRGRNRIADVDGDGRVDLITWNSIVATPTVYFNVGGQLQASGPPYPGNQFGAQRETIANNPGGVQQMTWQLNADLLDLDGDGIAEGVFFENGVFKRAKPSASQPPRLLSTVSNGRGATTKITYAHMNDRSTPKVVDQKPDEMWPDLLCAGVPCRPKASPRAQWVVKSMTTSDMFQAGTATTSYIYKNPRFAADDHGHYGFRGFEEVTTTHPGPSGLANGTGKTTIHRYGYNVDWSGRLVTTLVKPALGEGADDVRTIDTTTWQSLSLFSGALKTYHPSVAEHFTCANGQTDPAAALANPCTAATAPGYTRVESSFTGYPATPAPMLWVESRSLLKATLADGNGDRETLSTFTLDATPTTYELRPDLTTRNHRAAGAMALFGKSRSTWNPTTRELTEETWVDAANSVTSRSVLDATGNVIEKWKPKQNAAGTTKTTFAYDSRKLFAATVINELKHRVDSVFEYGTGATLLSEGPNERTCTVGCPGGAMKEQRKTSVDGLGRPIERWETVSENGYAYELFQVETNSYVDAVIGSTPTSSTNYSRVDELAGVWKQTKTELDGHGRPIKTIVYAQGSAPANHVTTYFYRADGTLENVSVPDPTANDATLVSYIYTFDSLGRPLTIRRPDSSNQSGVDIAYNGVSQTTTEVVGIAGGQIGQTWTINDKFGRLSQVYERTPTTEEWAITNYGYGPDDLVASILDPQAMTTTLVHDFAGRRTQITRGTRTWKYFYDANGNMTSEVAPYAGPIDPVAEANHMMTVAYDDLDRNTSKLIGRRGLSDPDLLLFATDHEVFTWDTHFKGQLSYWQAYPPVGNNPITMDLYSDGHGRRAITSHGLSIAGYAPMFRSFLQQYYWNGNVRYSRYFDWGGVGTNETLTKTHFDARGLPSKIEMLAPQVLNLAEQTRNVAGLVTKRRTNLVGPMTFVESNWTYDKLGRVINQAVQRNIAPTQVARQALTYFGNDDVKTLQHFLGTSSWTFTHTFDLRHQLTGVTTNFSSYFGASYLYDTAGRLTRATHTRTIGTVPGANLKPRSVNYVYAGTDPEQVTSLTNVSDGATYASYTYDAAGNQLTRSYPPTNELWEYVYDGKDQLRRVTRKLSGVVTGSEEYWYDAFGQRMAVVKKDAAGAKTELIWFIGDVQAHYNADGGVTKVYSHLSLGTPVARVERTGETTSSLEFQFHGLASNTIAAVAQNGTINASFSYAPFGEVLEATNAGGAGQGTPVHKRRFNDKFEDNIGGLAYYGARFYDKTLIGWTQSDPLYRFAPDLKQSDPRRANLYVFALQNSLRYLDPDGRESLRSVCGGSCDGLNSTKNPSGPGLEIDVPRVNEVVDTLGKLPAGAGGLLLMILSMPSDSPRANPPSAPPSGAPPGDPFFEIGRDRIGVNRDRKTDASSKPDAKAENTLGPDKGSHKERTLGNETRGDNAGHAGHWKKERKKEKEADFRDRKREREGRGRSDEETTKPKDRKKERDPDADDPDETPE